MSLRSRALLAFICVLGAGTAITVAVAPRHLAAVYQRIGRFLGHTSLHARRPETTEAALVTAIALLATALVISKPRVFRDNVGAATPAALGVIRMLACGSLLVVTLVDDPAHVAVLPAELRQSMGVMDILYRLPIGVDRFVRSGPGLFAFEALTILILILGMIGWRTRVVVPLGALCYLLLGGIDRQFSHLYHAGLVPLYVMAVLSWTPCGDGWSVDRFVRIRRGRPVPDPRVPSRVYGWARYACWVAIALPYTAAGLSKLRNGGLFWWNATNVRGFLYEDTLQPERFDWRLSLHLTHAPDLLFALLGIGTMIVELLFVLVLFSRVARLILPALAALMHVGIFFLQNVWFFDLILLQLAFYDLDRLPNLLKRRLAPARAATDECDARVGFSITTAPPALPRAVGVSVLAMLLLLASVYRIEFYPLTAWELYSGSDTSGRIEYYRALAHRESGVTAAATFEELGRTRSKDLIRLCFGPRQSVRLCQDALRAIGAAYNARARPGQRLRWFEIQRWVWSFRSHPEDAAYGTVIDRLLVPIDR